MCATSLVLTANLSLPSYAIGPLLAFGLGPAELVIVWIGFLAPVLIAIDSSIKKIPFLRDTYEPSDPVRWFFFTLFLWCIVVPFYLYHRHRILKRPRQSDDQDGSDS